MQGIDGTSVGFSGCFKFSQGWDVIWNDPVTVAFAGGGPFTITLNGLHFQSNWWMGPNGCQDLFATITLDSTPVPEPSILLLLGAGLVGLAAFKTRSKKT